MADDWSWAKVSSVPSTAWQNFYSNWDGHGEIGIHGYGTGVTRGYGFHGETSSGSFGWTIINLDTLVGITSPTVGVCLGHNMHGQTSSLDIVRFMETAAGPIHCTVKTDASNHIIAINGDGTVLGTSSYILPTSAADGTGPTYHIETIVTVDNAAGTFQVWVNDILVLDLSGVDTRFGGTGVIGHLGLHAEGGRNICEFFVHDGSDRLGSEYRVTYVPVASAGTYTSGTASSGTKLSCVDDLPTEAEDTTVVSLDDTGLAKRLSFVSGPMPALAVEIRDVHPQIVVKKSDGGTNTGKIGLKSGATEVYNGSAQAIPDAWAALRLALRTDVTAGNPLWTIVTAEAAEVILERDT